MKKISFILLFVAFATFIFTSCKEDQDVSFQNQNEVQNIKKDYTYEQIDLISQEISLFHNHVINHFLREIYKPGDVLNDDYILNLKQMIFDQVNNYEFKYLNKDDFKNELVNDEDFYILVMML